MGLEVANFFSHSQGPSYQVWLRMSSFLPIYLRRGSKGATEAIHAMYYSSLNISITVARHHITVLSLQEGERGFLDFSGLMMESMLVFLVIPKSKHH
jgi:hypothetical protein